MSQAEMKKSRFLASGEDILVMVIDYQEKLLPHVVDSEAVVGNACTLVRFCQMVSVPILATEQYPRGLGCTDSRISGVWQGKFEAFSKTTFSCARDDRIAEAIGRSGRSSIAVAGIETHICVAQTVCDLVNMGYNVHVLSDCTSARSLLDHRTGLEKMRAAGAVISTVEAFMFEVLVSCKHPRFKEFVNQIMKK